MGSAHVGRVGEYVWSHTMALSISNPASPPDSRLFHPSGNFLASANGDGKIDYWSLSGEPLQSFDWGVGKVNDVTFDPTGDRAACCAQSGDVVVWDVDR